MGEQLIATDRGEILLFVYGSLLSSEPAHHRLGRALKVKDAATVPEFDLVDLGAYPALLAGGRTSVKGEVYRLRAERIPALDAYESEEYERHPVRLTDGSEAIAYLYVADPLESEPRVISGDWRRR